MSLKRVNKIPAAKGSLGQPSPPHDPIFLAFITGYFCDPILDLTTFHSHFLSTVPRRNVQNPENIDRQGDNVKPRQLFMDMHACKTYLRGETGI